MQDTTSRYTRKEGVALIEIRLNSLQQLFNSFDPAPFHEKDLDHDAEDYIVGSVDEFPLSAPLKLVFHLPPDQVALAETVKLSDSIHNYFEYRLSSARRRLRFQLRDGRITLAIGLAFLFVCISLRQLAYALQQGTASELLAEGLLISGWVAMWRPLQIFLYDWWPVRHSCRLYAKLAAIPVEVQRTDAPGPSLPR